MGLKRQRGGYCIGAKSLEMQKAYFADGLYKHKNNQGTSFQLWLYEVTADIACALVIEQDLCSLPGKDLSCPLPASYL